MTAAPAAFDPKAATIVVVTFNRSHLLTGLLTSITAMDPKPGRVVIIDNASSDDTTDVVESFRDSIGTEIVYRRLETNTGGSGGFSEGMHTAYELGSEWIWMMDDDVEGAPRRTREDGQGGPRASRASRGGATTTTAASSTGSTASRSAWVFRSRSPRPASTTPDTRR